MLLELQYNIREEKKNKPKRLIIIIIKAIENIIGILMGHYIIFFYLDYFKSMQSYLLS
jgi:hypothetical protein